LPDAKRHVFILGHHALGCKAFFAALVFARDPSAVWILGTLDGTPQPSLKNSSAQSFCKSHAQKETSHKGTKSTKESHAWRVNPDFSWGFSCSLWLCVRKDSFSQALGASGEF
jgi:hypothetical protein